MPSVLPGKKGTDYHLVRYGDAVYAVYRVKLPSGKMVNVSWRVDKDDYKAVGVNPDAVNKIGKAQFQALNVFGSASEIARTGSSDEHPFQSYLKELRERYGHVSWLTNKEFMATMLMGWAENWSAAELEQKLKTTQWYQSRTDARRSWELDLTKEERQQKIENTSTRVRDALRTLYGDVDFTEKYKGRVDEISKKIASGVWGDPNEGFESWLFHARQKAEKVEGTAAWMEREQASEQQRAFMNRPEDMKEKIRQEAFEWLGPRGVPSDDVLSRWATNLVSQTKSEGDWQTFLRGQATSLYPYLGPEERWQDRASAYKKIIEDNWGSPVGWDNPLLNKIGAKGADGKFTGEALAADDFEALVRSRPEFWGGPVAKQEGFELFNYLNETFKGVA